MAANDVGQPIIKKIKKVEGHGHHGGAWKVAYADFVTAMMAFFMMMWLLNATSEEQRKGIADYFSPTLPISDVSAGGSALFNGDTIFSTEQMVSSGAGGSANTRNNSEEDHDMDDDSIERDTLFDFMAPPPEAVADAAADAEAGLGPDAAADPVAPREPTQEEIAEAAAREAEERDRQMAEISAAFEALKERSDGDTLLDHLSLKVTPEGLVIEVTEKDGEPLFQSGSADASLLMRKLMAVVAPIIAKLSNDVMIVGHTDARPFAIGSRLSNWELSADRANAARRLLTESGLPEVRIAKITGAADRQPLSDDPYAPENRRIGITLLRDAPGARPLPSVEALDPPADIPL